MFNEELSVLINKHLPSEFAKHVSERLAKTESLEARLAQSEETLKKYIVEVKKYQEREEENKKWVSRLDAKENELKNKENLLRGEEFEHRLAKHEIAAAQSEARLAERLVTAIFRNPVTQKTVEDTVPVVRQNFGSYDNNGRPCVNGDYVSNEIKKTVTTEEKI